LLLAVWILTYVVQPTLEDGSHDPLRRAASEWAGGLALWWIDHPELAKPVLVDVAVRVSEPTLQGVALSRSA
jgi:hypothetical protein